MNGFISNSCCWVNMDSRYLNRAHKHQQRQRQACAQVQPFVQLHVVRTVLQLARRSVTTNPVCTKLTTASYPQVRARHPDDDEPGRVRDLRAVLHQRRAHAALGGLEIVGRGLLGGGGPFEQEHAAVLAHNHGVTHLYQQQQQHKAQSGTITHDPL